MQHESFSSPDVADILNASFIPIKVDRESRPDIDEIYMNYVTATTGSGGWPLNVFLTPDLQPVFGGTYWPGPGASPSRRRPSTAGSDEVSLTFLDILQKMEEVWKTQRERCIESAADITRQLLEFAQEGTHTHSQVAVKGGPGEPPEPLELDLIDDALDHFVSRFDTVHGGFSPASPTAPKFPTPPNLAFLLRIGASITTTSTRFGFPSPVPPILGNQSCSNAATMALHTLMTISRSGLRDHLGHGFHRYSVTADWNLPHFEKMLYDNALLLGCYCDAWALARDPEILGTIYSLVEYFTAPDSGIANPEGAWFSSEDADSHPSHSVGSSEELEKEGAFYVWTLKEIQSLFGNETHATVLARHFGVKSNGNVAPEHDVADELLNQNVLHIAATPSVLAKELGLSETEIVQVIKDGRKKMAAYREKSRPRPAVDTKIVAAWNGLAISALVRANNTLADVDVERSTRCKEAAIKAADFVRRELYNETTGRLKRVYSKEGRKEDDVGFVDDYAYMSLAAHAIYDLTFDETYLDWADRLQEYLNNHFWAETSGGFFQAEKSTSSDRIINLKPGTDSALPSPNGIIAQNLFYLGSYLPEKKDKYEKMAKDTIESFAVEIIQHPFLFVSALGAVVMEAAGIKTIQVGSEVAQERIRTISGWGRTVRKMPEGHGIKADEVMICEGDFCRPLREGELDEMKIDGEAAVDSPKSEETAIA
jgi:uncharacterized protein YyaL (SSP411 family)